MNMDGLLQHLLEGLPEAHIPQTGQASEVTAPDYVAAQSGISCTYACLVMYIMHFT